MTQCHTGVLASLVKIMPREEEKKHSSCRLGRMGPVKPYSMSDRFNILNMLCEPFFLHHIRWCVFFLFSCRLLTHLHLSSLSSSHRFGRLGCSIFHTVFTTVEQNLHHIQWVCICNRLKMKTGECKSQLQVNEFSHT